MLSVGELAWWGPLYYVRQKQKKCIKMEGESRSFTLDTVALVTGSTEVRLTVDKIQTEDNTDIKCIFQS